MERLVQESKKYAHIGEYIRNELMGNDVSITDFALKIGIGRQALSKMINGKSKLSEKLAEKISEYCKIDMGNLLKLQTEYDQKKRKGKPIEKFIPYFISIKAHQIEEWGHDHEKEFGELVRKMILEINPSATIRKFHSGRNNNRKGFDGIVESTHATEMTPKGKSIWEISARIDVQNKADEDYKSRSNDKKLSKAEKKRTTLVIVNSNNFRNSDRWVNKLSRVWKEVRVIDACALETLLEKAPFAQLWLAENMHLKVSGITTLHQAWKKWSAVCVPEIPTAMFNSAIKMHKDAILTYLRGDSNAPISIAADSYEEMLAFLYCIFESDGFEEYKQRCGIFTSPDVLIKHIEANTECIAIMGNEQTAEVYNLSSAKMRGIVLHNKMSSKAKATIDLGWLTLNDVSETLKTFNKEDIATIEMKKCGASRSILRRHLSQIEYHPEWASVAKYASTLLSLSVLGYIDINNPTEVSLLEQLSRKSLEENLQIIFEIKKSKENPIIERGKYIGVGAKEDVFDLFRQFITKEYIELIGTLLDSGSIISNSSNRGLYSHISLRVLHSIISLKFITSNKDINNIGEKLFSDIITKKDVAQQEKFNVMPKFAELLPSKVISWLSVEVCEKQLNFATLDLYPIQQTLEILAWDPKTIIQSVQIFIQLYGQSPRSTDKDSIYNSLSSIFRWWSPQTLATCDERLAALKKFYNSQPDLFSDILTQQLDTSPQVGMYNCRPMFSPLPYKDGESIQHLYNHRYQICEFLLSNNDLSVQSLIRLINMSHGWMRELQELLLNYIINWSKTTNDSDKSILKECIRDSIAIYKNQTWKKLCKDKNIMCMLEPESICYKVKWMFESYNLFPRTQINWEVCSQKSNLMRMRAINQVYKQNGIKGIINLIEIVDHKSFIGKSLANLIDNIHHSDTLLLVSFFLSADFHIYGNAFRDMLIFANDDAIRLIINHAIKNFSHPQLSILFSVCTCSNVVWDLLHDDCKLSNLFWCKTTLPHFCGSIDDMCFALQMLMNQKRYAEAIGLCSLQIENIPLPLLENLLKSYVDTFEPGNNISPSIMLSYYCEKILKRLESFSSLDTLAHIEKQFVLFSHHSTLALSHYYIYLVNNPHEFVRCVKAMHSKDKSLFVAYYGFFNSIALQINLFSDIRSWVISVRSSKCSVAIKKAVDIQLGQLLARVFYKENRLENRQLIIGIFENIDSEDLYAGFRQESISNFGNSFEDTVNRYAKCIAFFKDLVRQYCIKFPKSCSRVFDLMAGFYSRMLEHANEDKSLMQISSLIE